MCDKISFNEKLNGKGWWEDVITLAIIFTKAADEIRQSQQSDGIGKMCTVTKERGMRLAPKEL